MNSSDGGSYAAFQFGNSSDKIVPADFTGDGKTDIAIWRPSTGEWFILRSEDSSYYSFPFGTIGRHSRVGDFDGDGEDDAAVFRPSDSNLVYPPLDGRNDDSAVRNIRRRSGARPITTATVRPTLPFTDLRTVNGGFKEAQLANVLRYTFGNSPIKPVQGDYTGDGKADVAVLASFDRRMVCSSEAKTPAYYSFPFGATGDIPAPARLRRRRKIRLGRFPSVRSELVYAEIDRREF